eukprot:2873447-Alexandrium_andersonii.AAC.1
MSASLVGSEMCIRDRASPGSAGLSQPRRLLRSGGMGGTPSPLLWAMAYDPVIEGVAEGAGSANPTYVDDLAAAIRGAAQALAVAPLPVVASHAAGLQ